MTDAELWELGVDGLLEVLHRYMRLVLDLGDVLAGERELDDALDKRLTAATVRVTAALRERV